MGTKTRSMNRTIADLQETDGSVNLVACKTCFETALFGEEVKNEKPYNALVRIREDESIRAKVKALLDYLIGVEGSVLPDNCIHWEAVEELA